MYLDAHAERGAEVSGSIWNRGHPSDIDTRRVTRSIMPHPRAHAQGSFGDRGGEISMVGGSSPNGYRSSR